MTPLELWENNRGLAIYLAVARHRKFSAAPRDDLVQAALLGLWRASLRWREDLSDVPFGRYAVRDIVREISEETWRYGAFGYSAGRAAAEGREPPQGPAVQFSQLPKAPDPDGLPLSVFEDHDLLVYIISRVRRPFWKTFARRFWLEGLPLATVAHLGGITEQTARSVKCRVLKEMATIADELKQEWGET